MQRNTEAHPQEHSKVWNEYEDRIDVIARECRVAELEITGRQKAELNAEDERHNEAMQTIYKKYDAERKPVRKPFTERIDALIAERDAAIKRLDAEHYFSG